MAFVEELKQRKVIRVAIGYLVAAWVGVQVASIALPAFEAPGWVLRVLILLLALGFPFALLLTWAVDLTPDGPRFVPGGVGWKRMIALSAGLGALALGWYFLGQPAWKNTVANATAEKPAPTASAAATPAAVAHRSIAVLPFVNMSGDPANEYFSDGLAETTLDMLAQVHDLKVIARTSSFAFKGKSQDVREIGRALGAAHLLEGSVQQAGKTVRITAQLIRVSDGSHMWSNRYDRQLVDVFKIQDEIAGEVVKALQVALPAAERERVTGKRTDNVDAYREFLRGVALLPGRRVADMRRALTHFQRAIEIDPGYASAHASAALTLGLLVNYTGDATPAEKALRKRYVDQALSLDPALGEAYAARAAIHEEARDFDAAEADFLRAIELAPNFATAHQWYAELVQDEMGDSARAIPLLQRALELDPLSPIIRNEMAFALAANGAAGEALQRLAELTRERPDFAPGHATRGRILESQGNLSGALSAWRDTNAADPAAGRRQASNCWTMLRFGALSEAKACVHAAGKRLGEAKVAAVRQELLLIAGDVKGALALEADREQSDPWELARMLLADGQYRGALQILQKLDPDMFMQPEPRLTSSYPNDMVLGGAALLGTGATAQGRQLLELGVKANASKPIVQLQFGRGWTDALALALLGEHDRACAALVESVAAGYYLDLPMLDSSWIVRELRTKPCYEKALAPARARAAAQRDAARKAGLL